MGLSRRDFLSASAGITALPFLPQAQGRHLPSDFRPSLDEALDAPVLRRNLFPDPLPIESIDLIENRGEYLVRARSDGAEGVGVGNSDRLQWAYPILLQQVAPYFIGKDARDLDDLVDGVYLHDSNYKLQGLPFWVCVAAVEFAVLDLLGQVAAEPIGNLLGDVVRQDVAVYQATNSRGRPAEDTVERMVRFVEETDTQAVKFKLGARMQYTDETMQRDKALIPLVRETFGEDMTIYSDANGSFDVEAAVEIGHLLEECEIDFFEEPCPFDHYDQTKAVADALSIDVAGGECESSLHQFQWLIGNDVHQVVQPDLHYFGGYIRATRVARMAQEAGIPITLHMSGNGLGYLQVLHFASYISNAGDYQEYKGKTGNLDFTCPTSDLTVRDSHIRVPSGPGFGIEIDDNFIAAGTVLEA
jgi:L-alanine-DL-glutamate epimerase-like enolase superfamily enzyme